MIYLSLEVCLFVCLLLHVYVCFPKSSVSVKQCTNLMAHVYVISIQFPIALSIVQLYDEITSLRMDAHDYGWDVECDRFPLHIHFRCPWHMKMKRNSLHFSVEMHGRFGSSVEIAF